MYLFPQSEFVKIGEKDVLRRKKLDYEENPATLHSMEYWGIFGNQMVLRAAQSARSKSE
jgi:hypothetical protein